ncbi:PREDICTED: phospholipase A1 1-like [Habropoda laboriosa]|uniref:phospholipase A1 1-like n=1 Tax=Habropoda laboriosa TaxID=597456 RepID=UPI00083E3CE5|nr:PREDICTED: phospholipase A1 1-like [Habropoda laboriosa]
MNTKSISVKIITTVLFILQQTYFCYADCDNLDSQENSIITNIIPACVFGVESVSYFLYTRNKPYGEEVRMNDEYIPIHINKKVAFLIHGFISEANNSNYFDFTVKLVQEYGVKVNEIVVVGHSLGAHVAGFSGKSVQDVFKQKYKQIIGLDPAGPKFANKDCANRLCKSDAAFVQIFHTSYLAGIHDAIGVDDFYFNGGNSQPGCIFTVCSHSRAVMYLTMTFLYSPCFIGTFWEVGYESILNWKECNPTVCSHPGLDTPEEIATGTFYVMTKYTEPYCTL